MSCVQNTKMNLEGLIMLTCAQAFVDHLTARDLRFNVDDKGDKVVVTVPFSGHNANCIFSGETGEYLSIYLFFESVPEDKYANVLVACNELNTTYKWVKFYIDSENDIMVQDDGLLAPASAGDEAFELILRMYDILKDAKPILMKAIYG